MTRLVLLSGWGVDARIWQPLADHWRAGVSVSTPDWPGYGTRSPLATPASLAELADAMAAELPTEAIWVGWSLGGLLAGALLTYLPPPRGLIQLGTGTSFCTPGGVTTAELAAFRRAFARAPDATLAHFQRWQLGGEPRPRDAHRQLCTLLDEGPPPDPATLAAGLEWLARLELSTDPTHGASPVARLTGARDPLLAPAAIADADRVLDHAGHCPMLSRPAALAGALSEMARVLKQRHGRHAEVSCP
ncbi:alpha/beta fold hydrolase [Halomonas sp. ML-15]|uniref:alpha/beta fold hydrolase n=1 Tax=Halomonas sp. ML-15 TaxID=2773305 RepID=UPI00174643E6|nr:alpha/beta fold hydrolase [Halomonas sp. ML-15]MBD3896135.1 alpha/beta fold hydrolase [Halomonas sp. ML-15]